MRPTRFALLASAVLLVGAFALPQPAAAEHIALASVIATPDPAGHIARFVYEEVNTGRCCSGGLSIDFGDGSYGYLADGLNQDTPAGLYDDGYVCDDQGCKTLHYVVEHPLGVPNSRVRFTHGYPAAGAYVVVWDNCCASNPLPEDVPERDALWTTVLGVLQGSPVGNEAGTVTVAVK